MQVEKTNTTEKTTKIDDINFKIKIMLNCYLHGILRLGEAMAAVQMNGFIVAASAVSVASGSCTTDTADTAEVNYATYLSRGKPELKEYIKDPIGYVRACSAKKGGGGSGGNSNGNGTGTTNHQSLMAALVNTHPHLFAIALTRGIETSQKQALIAAEMMCKCITADSQCLAICIFTANLVHKLVMIEDSALFLLEILNESAKIACEYLPAGQMRKSLMEIAGMKDVEMLLCRFNEVVGASLHGDNYCVLYIVCWVVRKMHEWINLFGKGNTSQGGIKTLLKFYADLMLDLEDIFAEVIERGDQHSANPRESNRNSLLFILPLLNAIAGVIIACYCRGNDVQSKQNAKELKSICLTYFAPRQQNHKLYQVALSWIEALLFE